MQNKQLVTKNTKLIKYILQLTNYFFVLVDCLFVLFVQHAMLLPIKQSFILLKLCFRKLKQRNSLAELDSIFNMVNRFVIDKVEVLRHSKGGNL
jgi:hypothetical protein